MGMQYTGEVLGLTTSRVVPRDGSEPFDSQTLHLLDGLDKVELGLSREAVAQGVPERGELVTVEVGVSAYATRSGGAHVRLTALRFAPNEALRGA